ncbi:protein HP-25-like protein 1-like [Sesbania bispinosa]|nr:protein HP-25-like protein 1-like [Sesbania bispinosa]
MDEREITPAERGSHDLTCGHSCSWKKGTWPWPRAARRTRDLRTVELFRKGERERERRKEGRDGGAHSSGGATRPCLKVEEDLSRWLDGEDNSCEGEGRGSPARYRVVCGRLDDGGGDHSRWTQCSFERRELHSGDG